MPAGMVTVACFGRIAAALVAHASSRGLFLIVRQAVPHVEQCLLVHRLVLECRENRLAATHRAMPAACQIELRPAERVDDRLVGTPAERQHLVAGRPDRPGSAARHRVIDAVRIDAAFEQALHFRVDARLTEPALQQGNDAEGRQVPFVEHDRIPQRDGPRVVRVGIEQIEQAARSLTVALIPVDQTLAIDRNRGGDGGQRVPLSTLSRVHELRRRIRPSGFRKRGEPAGLRQTTPTRRKKASPTGVGLAQGCFGRMLENLATRPCRWPRSSSRRARSATPARWRPPAPGQAGSPCPCRPCRRSCR